MSRQLNDYVDIKESQVQENITNWQSSNDPMAPITDDQIDNVYELGDLLQNIFGFNKDTREDLQTSEINNPTVFKIENYILWMITTEEDIRFEGLKEFQQFYENISRHQINCTKLCSCTNNTSDSLNELKLKYFDVTEKTNYLHDLSEQLMAQQRVLKEKKNAINRKLKFFTDFNKFQESIERPNLKLNSSDCIKILDNIDESILYLDSHLQYKESRVYKMKYESLLNRLLSKIYDYVSGVIINTTKQVIDTDSKTYPNQSYNDTDSIINSAFALYYGKFQSSSTKVNFILNSIEHREEHNQYKIIINDCQKIYLTQRLPIISMAVSKALNELKCKYRNDHSVLFRSSSLFVMKICQDEAKCYNYFFTKTSELFNDYLGTLCQYLYDVLRPSLITINHIEVLSELCGILKEEILNEKVIVDCRLLKFIEAIKQLLQDVEERLVFRANVFFHHDLHGYKPSSGDLAYPEKLEQMESIALELRSKRTESRNSEISLESREVAQINAAQMAHFRSYTGSSPADLHGMWYPTVKRTLVCLSRLYFCLDRDTFQALAQEALVICIQTVHSASDLITSRKSPEDGYLFQIKHLLIIREQIAPFQVDFTAKEMTLDFSTVHKAAIDLIHHRNKIFTFGSNNAILEFLLEGTPKVKEYLIDSRKEIDKYLKNSCEGFIRHVTWLLIGNVLNWLEKAEHILKIIQAEDVLMQELTISGQDFGHPSKVADIIKEVQRNMKSKIPEIQRAMQLYLSNKETEFILFRPIKNNIVTAFMQLDQILVKGAYSNEDLLLIACPSPEQINVLICSVSLASRYDDK